MSAHLDPSSPHASSTMVVVFPPPAAQMMIRLVDGIENVFGNRPGFSSCEKPQSGVRFVIVHIVKKFRIVGKIHIQNLLNYLAPVRLEKLGFERREGFVGVVMYFDVWVGSVVLIFAPECVNASVVVGDDGNLLFEQHCDLKK